MFLKSQLLCLLVHVLDMLGPCWGLFGAVFGLSWGRLGAIWGHFFSNLGIIWNTCLIWGHLLAILGLLKGSGGLLGAIFGPLWGVPWPSYDSFGAVLVCVTRLAAVKHCGTTVVVCVNVVSSCIYLCADGPPLRVFHLCARAA